MDKSRITLISPHLPFKTGKIKNPTTSDGQTMEKVSRKTQNKILRLMETTTQFFSKVQDEVILFGSIPCIIDQNVALSMDYNIVK